LASSFNPQVPGSSPGRPTHRPTHRPTTTPAALAGRTFPKESSSVSTVMREDRNGIAVIMMNRPPANALAPDFLADGLLVLRELQADPPRGVVLSGAGRFFSGGADLRLVPTLDAADQAEMARGVNELFAGWHQLPCPVVCAVNGHAVAGGLVLALCGDYRVGVRDASYGLTEVEVGIPFPSEAMTVVRAELAPAVVRRLVLGGGLFDGERALALGILDEIAADPRRRALEVVADLAGHPPMTYRTIKRRLRPPRPRSAEATPPADSAREVWIGTEAAIAGPRKLEKRRPSGPT
jgi:enoyl-CoA hydratase